MEAVSREEFLHHPPGMLVHLEYGNPLKDDAALARLLAEGVGAFSEFVVPLVADLDLGYRQPDWLPDEDHALPPQPFWHLQAASLPAGMNMIEPLKVGAVVERIPAIGPGELLTWLQRACAQPNPRAGRSQITPTFLHVRASEARLFEPRPSDMPLRFLTRAGWVEASVRERDGALWGTGPTAGVPAPFAFTFYQQYGGLDLEIYVSWSPWTRAGSPGHAALRSAVGRLTDHGWILDDLNGVIGGLPATGG
jgi:hypothetical protein